MLAGKYSSTGMGNFDLWLKAHDEENHRVDRKGSESFTVERPSLTAVLTVQPEVIKGLASKPGFRGRGLLGRFLYSMPESLVGSRAYADVPISEKAQNLWKLVVRAVFRLDPGTAAGLGPPELLVGGEALEVWRMSADKTEAAQAEGGTLAQMSDWASKLAGQVARIAGVLHCSTHAMHSPNIVNLVNIGISEHKTNLKEILLHHSKKNAAAPAIPVLSPSLPKPWLVPGQSASTSATTH